MAISEIDEKLAKEEPKMGHIKINGGGGEGGGTKTNTKQTNKNKTKQTTTTTKYRFGTVSSYPVSCVFWEDLFSEYQSSQSTYKE